MNETMTTVPACRYCDAKWNTHAPELCPKVRAIEYRKDGSVKRVELVRAPDYAQAPYYWHWQSGGTMKTHFGQITPTVHEPATGAALRDAN